MPSACRLTFVLLCLGGLVALAGCQTQSPGTPAPAVAKHQRSTYVIVHGAWGGGWDWKPIDHRLTADGNTVYRPTLTGLGEHSNLDSTNIDLDTHIQDIVNVILWEDLHEVVLVGHSYGGMVITGVADRVPDRIRQVIYVDGWLPENGESHDTCRAKLNKKLKMPVTDGFILPFWVQGNPSPPHDVPMPARCFSQPIVLTNQLVAQKLPTTYILTVDPGRKPDQDEFFPCYQRARDRGWHVVIMEGDHNVQRSHPQELVALFESAH